MDYVKDAMVSAICCLQVIGKIEEEGKKGLKFMDGGYLTDRQAKNIGKHIVGHSIPYPYAKYKFLGKAGFFDSSKKGFALEEYSVLYSDQFYGKPIKIENLIEIKRDGKMVTFVEKDGRVTRVNGGEAARYLEAIFQYAIPVKENRWNGSDNPYRSALYQDVKGYYNSDIATWEEYRSKYGVKVEEPKAPSKVKNERSSHTKVQTKPAITFEEAKEKALNGDYEMAVKVFKDFKDHYPADEKGPWALKALNSGMLFGVKKIDIDVLSTVLKGFLHGDMGLEENLTDAFHCANIMARQYGDNGYSTATKWIQQDEFEAMGNLAIAGDEDAAKQFNLFLGYNFLYAEWPDIKKGHRKRWAKACDPHCRSFATEDVEQIAALQTAFEDMFSAEAEELYVNLANEGNPYALYMYDYTMSPYVKDSIWSAACKKYPPALFEFGRYMQSEIWFEDFGKEVIEYAAACGCGEAVEWLYRKVYHEEMDIPYEKLLEYAETAISWYNDYNAMHVKANIYDIQRKPELYEWYQKAGQAGHADSAWFTADEYRDEGNHQQAYAWYNIAIQNAKRIHGYVPEDWISDAIAYPKHGLGMEQNLYLALEHMVDAISYNYHGKQDSLLAMFEDDHRKVLVEMAQLAKSGDDKAIALWNKFETACKENTDSIRTMEDYL